MTARTFAIGDIHGDAAALDRLIERMPPLSAGDTLVFMGDYVDRGADSKGVIDRVRHLQKTSAAKVVCLRGNHEDKWIECWREPDLGFLLPRVNGCANMFRSFVGEEPLGEDDDLSPTEIARLLDVPSWLPRETVEWMESLPLWYEDEHALYVHAGLEGRRGRWKHPSECEAAHLLWMRRYDFYTSYRGKKLVFGHTSVDELPNDHLGPYARFFAEDLEVWLRGDLVGVDTACGKGGHLSAIELPMMRIYDSRRLTRTDVTRPMPLLLAAAK